MQERKATKKFLRGLSGLPFWICFHFVIFVVYVRLFVFSMKQLKAQTIR